MKYFSLILILLVWNACSSPTNNEEELFRLIPDRTPYIAGLVEATYDTVHHFPEVFVGYVSDPAFVSDPFNYFYYTNETVYNTTLWAQITGTIQMSKLVTEHEEDAVVIVTGPMGESEEQTVNYTYINEGIYGDTHSELVLKPRSTYRLDVTLPDGRSYTRTTTIPSEATVDVEDTVYTQVVYRPYDDGTPFEWNNQNLPEVYISIPEDSYITELQTNTSHDDKFFYTDIDQLLFAEKGNYMRRGIIYSIRTYAQNERDTLLQTWSLDIGGVKKNDPDYSKREDWYRISHFSKEIGERFNNFDEWIVPVGEEYERIENKRINFSFNRDSTYLKEVSTILKRAEDGTVLPKAQSDAIGFFAGYFSVYKKVVLIPERLYNVDSVLVNYQ